MDIVDPAIDAYLKDLAASDDTEVLLEMEALAEERGFPIIGRLCGGLLELLARSIGARRVFEMGSGFGYSAYWFSRAVGPAGEVHLTDTDPANESQALAFLERAELHSPVRYHVADAFEALDAADGTFDIVYCDIDKAGYRKAWTAGRARVRVGGLYICDNMLWSGRVTGPIDDTDTEVIDDTNRAIASDEDWRSVIVPLRDGVVAALRLR